MFLKNLLLVVVVGIISHYLAFYFGNIYGYFFPGVIGGGGLFSAPHDAGLYFVGLPLSYTFFLALLFTALGGAKKYWWIGILLIPAVIFEVYFDLSHIYFPIALGLLGWLLGWLSGLLIQASEKKIYKMQ